MSSTLGINQMNQLANKFTKVGWDEARVTQLGQANAQKFRAIEEILDGKSLEEAIKAAVATSEVGQNTSHLRFLESVTLAPTTGSTTLAEAEDVFTGYLDSDFRNWGTNKFGQDTVETTVDIHEMSKDGNYRTLFGSFGRDLHSLVMTQGQIKEFARTHRHLLRQDGYATFFLFEVKGELFVALVIVSGGGLGVHVHRFGDGHVWIAVSLHRVVVPQLTA